MKGPDYIFFRYLVRPLLSFYLRTDRNAKFDGFRLRVKKGVFHPLFFFSTRFFYRFIQGLELEKKTFLEIGCGSGLLSLLAHRKGAVVTAVDINPDAVASTKKNFEINFPGGGSAVKVLESDVFAAVPSQRFDVVVVNPPYFFKDAHTPAGHAWYCGSEGKFFTGFFGRLGEFTNVGSGVFMILADNCDIARIKSIAGSFGFSLLPVAEKKIRWELNFIFRIVKNG